MMNSDPVKLSKSVLHNKLEDALDLVINEFTGLNSDQQYRNAFARLLKYDPLDRIAMMGTNQRDEFIPLLGNQIIHHTSTEQAPHILDAGGGDGQTFALVANDVRSGDTKLSMFDPNPYYVERYQSLIERIPRVTLVDALAVEMDDYQAPASVFNLVLCIHSLYFFQSLTESLNKLYRCLKPGGSLFIVFADESISYTGHCVRSFYKAKNNHQALRDHHNICTERRELLSENVSENDSSFPKIGAFLDELNPEHTSKVHSIVQPTRLFGHSFSDILAVCNLTELSSVTDVQKFKTSAEFLRENFDTVGLQIENQGPRAGMISVLQQQIVVTIEKSA